MKTNLHLTELPDGTPASNKQIKNYLKNVMLRFSFLLVILFSIQPQNAQASHFRYGHLTWQKVSGNTVRFTLVDAFRRSGYGAPNIGDVITETVGLSAINFGDGSFTPTLQYEVIAIDIAEDWIIGRALDPNDPSKSTVDHTYATPTNAGTPWLAEVNAAARTAIEVNNPGGNYRLLTYVETNSGNRSPSSGLPAIVTLKQSAASTFIVPGTDPDPNTSLVFRLATSAEAAGLGVFNQPAGLTINPVTGLVTWNTLATIPGQLYSCQVIIEDRNALTGALRTQVPVDFLIEIVSCANDLAPVFIAPSPTCGSTINVTELQPLSFTVKTSDPDGGDIVTLNTGGLPPGATATPVLPTAGNPTSTIINWTPIIGSAGNYVLVFTATDNCGIQTICSYTIHVTACNVVCNLGLSFTSTKTNCLGSCDGSVTANPTNGVGPYSYLWSNGQTTKCAVGLCKGSYTVTVTDSRGCTKKGYSTVTSPTGVKIYVSQTNVKCKGSCTGILTAYAYGGSGTGYTYRWSNTQTTASINNLCKGSYTVTVTDSKGCTAKITKSITEPSKGLAVTTTKTTCSICAPNCNGTATANATGGTIPYTYLWSNGQQTKKIFGLCAGTYTVTVTDKNGCTAVCQAVLVSTCCNVLLTLSSTENTNCKPCNGTVTANATGGNNYSYSWSNGATTASVTGLCAGEYSVTVSSQGCPTVTKTIVVNDNIIPVQTLGITGNISICEGDSTILVASPIAGVSYCWENSTDSIWDFVGVQGFSGILTSYSSLAFNSSGIPYVGFKDSTDGANTVMKFDGGFWSNVGSEKFGGNSSFQSLAFDGDTPYLAYVDDALGGFACVRMFDGSDWVPVGSLDFSSGAVQYISLAINSGTPYVAFQDVDNGNTTTVMKFNGGNWETVGIVGFSIVEAGSQRLVFNGNIPFVAFSDLTNGDKTTVMKFDGIDWLPVGAVDFSAGSANYLSLAFDGSTPVLAYQDNFNADKSTVMKFDGSNWVTVGLAGFTPNVAFYQSLAILNGTPYVAFLDGENGDRTSVMKFDGSNWVFVGAAGFSTGGSFYQSAAFNGNELYVAFIDGGNENRVSVMKFNPSCISDNDSLLVTKAGTYVATVTNQFGCTAYASVNVTSQLCARLNVLDGCALPCCSATLKLSGIDVSQIVSVHWEVDQLHDDMDTRSCDDFNFIDVTNTDTVLNNVCSGEYTVTVNLLSGGPLVFTGTVISGTINPFLYTIFVSCYNDCTGDVFSLSAFASDVSLLDTNGISASGVMCPDVNYIYTSIDVFGCVLSGPVSVPNAPQLIANCTYNIITAGIFGANVIASGGNDPYEYLWSDGQTTQSIITNGIPNVTVTDTYGCSVTSSCFNDIRSSNQWNTTSVLQSSSIFPNPFSEGILIKYSGDDEFSVTITDLRGRVVTAVSGISKQTEMGKELAPGMYMVSIESNDGYRMYQKVIKTK